MENDFKAFQSPSPKFSVFVEEAIKRHKRNEGDTVLIVFGKEQTGKSTLVTRIVYQYFKNDFYSNGEWSLNNMVFTGRDLIHKAATLEKSVIWDDEAATHLYSGDHMTTLTKDCLKVLQLCGQQHNLIIFCIPEYFRLVNYVRERRVDYVIKVLPNHKFVAWNFRDRINHRDTTNSNRRFVKPHALGWWSNKNNPPEYTEFLNAYFELSKGDKKKEMQNIGKKHIEIPDNREKTETKEEIIKKFAWKLHKGGISQTEIGKSIGKPRETINRWFKKFRDGVSGT